MSALAETIPTEMPEAIVFTDSAAAKVADLIAEEGNPDLKLRVCPRRWLLRFSIWFYLRRNRE